MVENGTIVVLTRYWQSNLVYGISNGMDESWLLKLDKGLPKEDLVLLLLVNPTTSKNRAETQDTFEGDVKLAAAVYKNYQKYAKKFGWKVLDGSRSKEQVHQEILKIARKALKV
jgi:dTMP kinase